MITELIEFNLKEGADESEFLTLLKRFHEFFKHNFTGYAGLESTKGENRWVTIMHWESMKDVHLAGETLKNRAREVAEYQSLTDLSSIRLTFLERKMVLD